MYSIISASLYDSPHNESVKRWKMKPAVVVREEKKKKQERKLRPAARFPSKALVKEGDRLEIGPRNLPLKNNTPKVGGGGGGTHSMCIYYIVFRAHTRRRSRASLSQCRRDVPNYRVPLERSLTQERLDIVGSCGKGNYLSRKIIGDFRESGGNLPRAPRHKKRS